jgi:hypothetical protein
MEALEARRRAAAARAVIRGTKAAERAAIAESALDAALRAAGTDALTVPGARVTRTPDGIAVTALPRINPDQLTVWSL